MGTLKPDATYVYENADGVIYAREVGAHISTRKIIGYESLATYKKITGQDEDQLWKDIRLKAEDHPSLQQALERVKIIYYMLENGNGKT